MNEQLLRVVRTAVSRAELRELSRRQFGDLVKAVVDTERRIMAVGGELHSDEEALLLDDGSRQADLWGINLYPQEPESNWIEYDSVINVRPSQGNRSRGVDDAARQVLIREIVNSLVVSS